MRKGSIGTSALLTTFGSQSGLAAGIMAVTVGVVAMLATPAFYYLPKPSLALLVLSGGARTPSTIYTQIHTHTQIPIHVHVHTAVLSMVDVREPMFLWLAPFFIVLVFRPPSHPYFFLQEVIPTRFPYLL